MNYKARVIFDKLCEKAAGRICFNDAYTIRECMAHDKPFPDHLLPGRFIINNCSPEEREYLSELSSDVTAKYRPSYIYY